MSNLNIKITAKERKTYEIQEKEYEKLEKIISYANER